MSSESFLDRVLARFEGVEARNGHHIARCPAHDDHTPSLQITKVGGEDGGKVLLKCWAGCENHHILKAAGLEWRDLFSGNGSKPERTSSHIVDTYDYTDAEGNLLYQTVRYEAKAFRQRRPDGNGGWVWNLKGIEPVLYNLPKVSEAIHKGEPIYLLEGEKDCDRAWEELGITATTCPMGAGKWRDSYTEALRGARVVLIPDNDKAGQKHMPKVAQKLVLWHTLVAR